VPTCVAASVLVVLFVPLPWGVTVSTSTTVWSGAVRVKVIVPLSLYPPERTAESCGIALPTTLPAQKLAVVMIVGLDLTVITPSLAPSSSAAPLLISPL
jgi:hypothetical protein